MGSRKSLTLLLLGVAAVIGAAAYSFLRPKTPPGPPRVPTELTISPSPPVAQTAYAMLVLGGGGGGGGSGSSYTYTISFSGTLQANGVGMGGQTVSLSANGAHKTSVTTDSSGNFSGSFPFTGTSGESVTVTAYFAGATSGQYEYESSRASATITL